MENNKPMSLELKKEVYEALQFAATYAHRFLKNYGGLGYEYAESRGLDTETINKFKIGYFPFSKGVDQFANRMQMEFSPEVLESSNLFFHNKRGELRNRFYGRLIFPIVDIQIPRDDPFGQVVGFGGRYIGSDPDAAKYINSINDNEIFIKDRIFFGLNRARNSIVENGIILVCEGYMDCVAYHRAGVDYAIATMGTALSESKMATLAPLNVNRLILAFDNDDAGLKATLDDIEKFILAGYDVKVLRLNEAKDADDYFKTHTIDDFNRLPIVSGARFMMESTAEDVDKNALGRRLLMDRMIAMEEAEI